MYPTKLVCPDRFVNSRIVSEFEKFINDNHSGFLSSSLQTAKLQMAMLSTADNR